MQTSNKIGTDPIYDARTLGTPRMLVLGVQHMFAMFGATVLVPALTGLNVATTLLLAGLGTLLFHLITKGKVPAFLGSSFAFLGGYWAIAPNGEAELLPYACVGVACAGLLYILLAILFKTFGPQKVMRFFPPIVTGPIIISIGLTLSSSALDNCATNWWIALVAILVVVVCNIWGKGMVKIIPILLGVVASYLAAALAGQVDFIPVREAAWIGLPVHMENTGVLALSKVYDPRVIRIAAILAILLSFSPKFAALISAMPAATMGGVSLVLYGMISAVGVRNVVENRVDFTSSRNVIIAALILVLSIGIAFSAAGAVAFQVGSATISLSGLAVAALTGILLNAVLPGMDYEFGADLQGDTSVNFKV